MQSEEDRSSQDCIYFLGGVLGGVLAGDFVYALNPSDFRTMFDHFSGTLTDPSTSSLCGAGSSLRSPERSALISACRSSRLRKMRCSKSILQEALEDCHSVSINASMQSHYFQPPPQCRSWFCGRYSDHPLTAITHKSKPTLEQLKITWWLAHLQSYIVSSHGHRQHLVVLAIFKTISTAQGLD